MSGNPSIHGVEGAKRRKLREEWAQRTIVKMDYMTPLIEAQDKGSAPALRAWLSGVERLAKLWGLDAPEQVEQTVTTVTPDLAELVARARAQAAPGGE